MLGGQWVVGLGVRYGPSGLFSYGLVSKGSVLCMCVCIYLYKFGFESYSNPNSV